MISKLENFEQIDDYETSKLEISKEEESQVDEEHSSCKDTIKLNE